MKLEDLTWTFRAANLAQKKQVADYARKCGVTFSKYFDDDDDLVIECTNPSGLLTSLSRPQGNVQISLERLFAFCDDFATRKGIKPPAKQAANHKFTVHTETASQLNILLQHREALGEKWINGMQPTALCRQHDADGYNYIRIDGSRGLSRSRSAPAASAALVPFALYAAIFGLQVPLEPFLLNISPGSHAAVNYESKQVTIEGGIPIPFDKIAELAALVSKAA